MKERTAPRIEGLILGHKADGRCIYSRAGKKALVEACLQPGVSVAASAQANGVNANLLRKWIRQHQVGMGKTGRRNRGLPRQVSIHTIYETRRTTMRLVTAIPIATLAAGTAFVTGAQAQKYPNRPVRMLVPWTAGSQTDILARMVQPKLSDAFGQPIVIDNRPGAGGTIGAAVVATANPDGHTLMMQAAAHAVSPALYAKLPYDAVNDFACISRVGSVPNVLVVAPALGIKSVKELIALAKQKPGQINFTSAGIGGGTHINGEQFKMAAGIDVVHVPQRGTPDALIDTVTGRVHYFFAPLGNALPFVRDRRLLPLAVSTLERAPALPQVPTVAESGFPGFDFDLWYGLMAPAKTPKPILDQLSREMRRILALPDIRERMAEQGVVPRSSTPEEFDQFLREEVARLGKIVRASGARVN